MTALVFLDTETTGLTPEDEIWEFAAIRREEDGTETRRHLFVQHNTQKCARLPEKFLADHRARFPISPTAAWHPETIAPYDLARAIADLTADRPHIVGAVPNFDTEHLARLLRFFGMEPSWHHRLRCVETLACGALGREVGGLGDAATALGIGFDPAVAHTAMGDAELAMRIWDEVIGCPYCLRGDCGRPDICGGELDEPERETTTPEVAS